MTERDGGTYEGQRCAYCGTDLGGAVSRFDVEINAWDAGNRYAAQFPNFCGREHLTAYFAEDRLPADMFEPGEDREQRGCFVAAMVTVILVALLAIVGLTTVLRWLG